MSAQQPALLLSIDFEDWHQLVHRTAGAPDWDVRGPALERQTAALLDLLDELGATATFFFLGMTVRRYPELAREIASRGHEPACHGFAHERVFHAGDGVAAVAAVTEQIAADALEKIKIEYEEFAPVLDPLESLKLETPGVHAPSANIYGHKLIKKGDIEKGFAESYRIFEASFRTQMVEHVPLEPHSSLAQWDANGRLTIHSTLGRITLGRADIARTLGIPMSRIRIIATVVGGNFGGKNEITTEPVIGMLAKKTGRPVKCTFTRPEEFYASTTRHPIIMDYKTGVTKEGKILARKVRLVLDGGAYCSWSETTLGKACILCAGPYEIENLVAEAFVVYTNKTMTGAMRGFGAPQVCFGYESHMDDMAKALGIDPLEMRLRNVLKEGSLSPTSQALHSVVVKESLLQAAKRFGWNVQGAGQGQGALP